MAWTLDARIPLLVVESEAALATALAGGGPAAVLLDAARVGPAGAVAVERFEPGATHVAGCACCGGRSAAAVALDRLFQARVRGTAPWFARVVVLVTGAAGRAMVRGALAGDAVTGARFRAA